jgi:hypothetical protein
MIYRLKTGRGNARRNIKHSENKNPTDSCHSQQFSNDLVADSDEVSQLTTFLMYAPTNTVLMKSPNL